MTSPIYRTSRDDQVNGQFPLRPDHRPRASLPVLASAPASLLQCPQAITLGPLLWSLESARVAASLAGDDVCSLAQQPARCAPAEPALHTLVHAAAWQTDPRNWMLGFAFVVGEIDPDRLAVQDRPPLQADPLQEDYVSVMLDLDRRGERAVEIGVTRDGRIFVRNFHSFLGNNWSEPGLSGEAAVILAEAQRAAGSTEPTAWEDRSTRQPSALSARLQWTRHGWSAELRVPLNRFGQYGESGLLYPCNLVRHRRGAIPGAPAGINWKAGPPVMTWAPVRFLPENAGDWGFLGVDVPDPHQPAQVRTIDQALAHHAVACRVEAVQRDLDSHEQWRRQRAPMLRTQWSARTLAAFHHLHRGPTLNNSRQVITLASGRTLVLLEDADRLTLAQTDEAIDPVERIESWQTQELIGVAGLWREALGQAQGHVRNASMLLGSDDRLHVAFALGNQAFHATAALDRLQEWSVSPLPWPALAWPYDLEHCGRRVVAIAADPRGTLWLHDLSAGEPRQLPWRGACPVLACAAQGGLHLAYESNAAIHHVRLDDRLQPCGEPSIAAYGVAAYPALVEVDGRPILAFQWLGVQKGTSDPGWYIADRERGSGGIGAAWLAADGRWRRQTLMELGETVVRRLNSRQYMLDMVSRPHRGRAFLAADENWRPSIAADDEGVVHVAWQNTTRRHAFACRWSGEDFSAPMELAGPLNDPAPRLSLEKSPRRGEPIKFTLMTERRLALDAWPTQAVRLERSDSVLFADEMAVQRTRNARWCATPLRRLGEDPALELPGSGRGAGRDGLSQPFVAAGAHGGFVMAARDCGKGQWVFAGSDDGVRFTLIPREEFLRQLDADTAAVLQHQGDERHGGPGFNLAASWRGLEDLLEPDPDRRFKKIVVEGEVIDLAAVRRVHYSPDGLRWTAGPEAVNNVHLNETHVPNVYDPWDLPQRRFKIYGRTTTEQGRTLAMLWSGDMIHWQGDHDIVTCDGFDSRRPAAPAHDVREGFVLLEGSAGLGESEHYFCMPRLECGLYLLFYGALLGDGRKQLRLAMSRDGFHFRRVGHGPLLATGAAGAFDSGSIDSIHLLECGRELRVYYAGSGEKHGSLPVTAQHAIGVAAIPLHGWGGYRSRGPGAACVQTVALSLQQLLGRQLVCHAEGVVGDASLRAELIDAGSDRPIAVHGALQSDPISDGPNAPVTWAGRAVSWPAGVAHVRLRFTWTGSDVRLHGFALPLPGPRR
jgi:hypothetical protein